jgi:lysozyme
MPAIDLAAPFVRKFEGCQLQAYADEGGKLTIGVGHCGPEVHEGLIWTDYQAEQAFLADLKHALNEAQKAVVVGLTDKQWAAIISFVFNLGAGSFRNSTLCQFINQHKFIEAAKEFTRWCRVDGREDKGLLRRRFSEAALFLEGS